MPHDYSAYTEKKNPEGLEKLAQLAREQRRREQAVEDAEAALKRAKEHLRLVQEIELPELMDELGLAEFRTEEGLKIKVDDAIRASISKDRRAQAILWLRSHGHGNLVKRTVSVDFGKGEDEGAQKLIKTIEAEGHEFQDNPTVHPSTLSAWVRARLAEGEDIPFDLFGVHQQRRAKVDAPK